MSQKKEETSQPVREDKTRAVVPANIPQEILGTWPEKLLQLVSEYAPLPELLSLLDEAIEAKQVPVVTQAMIDAVPRRELELRWLQAVEDANKTTLREVLLAGFIPSDLSQKIIIDGKPMGLIDIVLDDPTLESLDVADSLYRFGAPLPGLHQEKEEYSSTELYLCHLASDAQDLFITLKKNPAILHEVDDDGMTLLHHTAGIGHTRKQFGASLILDQLFKVADAKCFLSQDRNGNTPLHLAAMASAEKVSNRYVLPTYIEAATKIFSEAPARRSYFSMLSQQGQTALHIATRTCYQDLFIRRNNISGFLAVPDIDINQLSSSGSTALWYSLNQGLFDQAALLLDQGADPTLGSEERQPLKQINDHLLEYAAALESEEYDDSQKEKLRSIMQDLELLRDRVLAYVPAQAKKKDEKQAAAQGFASFFGSSTSSASTFNPGLDAEAALPSFAMQGEDQVHGLNDDDEEEEDIAPVVFSAQ